MAHVILALLLLMPGSLYDLVKRFEASVSLFYSASNGSIKRALDQLLASGQIELADSERQPRGRRVYRVTAAGAEAFHAWATGPISGDLETAMLARVHFLGLLEASERPAVLRGLEARAAAELEGLEAAKGELHGAEVAPEHREVFAWQLATLDYGIGSTRHARDWLRGLIDEADAA
ncbi:PadR family transcriptional regulator [Agrococcus baldri]|uniref:Transcription regulator PadR N-terminal domain-containing protein n=1 Tax=Agrococcus baldri TaxID=153730 RepID=A0AA87RDX3_9MICO|nr:PadR family transcriptional regulator [Agrococcus baldri]GEK81124.1 hypothetical protein ABA31_24750 [Agrococcus baldri]